ncbi:MAG: hypothetical protein KA746_11795 [Pyrinomonadaceae bacterium]|nr:hypothetical protein [Pyrinomonadaceae bacterium]MBP6211677.1 hypothetical protein [Pyrinomonadaceae bacterium]
MVEFLDNAGIEPLMLAIPETAGLLVIGLGLLSADALMRRVFCELRKSETVENLEDTI